MVLMSPSQIFVAREKSKSILAEVRFTLPAWNARKGIHKCRFPNDVLACELQLFVQVLNARSGVESRRVRFGG